MPRRLRAFLETFGDVEADEPGAEMVESSESVEDTDSRRDSRSRGPSNQAGDRIGLPSGGGIGVKHGSARQDNPVYCSEKAGIGGGAGLRGRYSLRLQ